MKVTNYSNVKLENVDAEGANATKIRWLIDQADSAPNFAMRMFEIEKDGHTPFHIHPWEHEVFIIEGEGAFVTEEKETPFKKWDVIYADPNLKHQFKNTGSGMLRFLCMIPHQNATVPKAKKTVNPFASGRANNC